MRFLRTTDIQDDGRLRPDDDGVFVPERLVTNYILKCGDLLFSRSGTLGRGYLHMESSAPFAFAGYLVRFRPKYDHDPRYLFYASRSTSFLNQINADAIQSTIGNFNAEKYGNIRVWVPPFEQQRAIADFLDRKTAAIDALIDKKRKLLDLLAEKRAALINHAVTKGLNPDAPMKGSGIPWIGEIPTHWAVAPLNSRYSVQLGKMLDSSKVTGTRLAPYLRNADVHWDRINTTDLPQMDFSASDRKKFELRAGDILMCEGGANQKVVGRSAIWSGSLAECYYQKALHRIRLTRSEASHEQPRFLLFAIQAASDVGLFVADSNANIFHLPAERLRILRFPFPPPDEQKRIVRELDRALASSRAAEGTIGDQIERLHEYRQALITAAVTGQLDVTNEAAA
ncbi:MAG: restriction endonuclease subunit S [Deltaproteobacteria bacterium]